MKRCEQILKNIAGQVLTYNSNFHWQNKKLDIERTMSDLGNPFLKKADQKSKKKQKINVKIPHVNIKTTRNEKLGSNKKLDLEWTMNWLGKPFRKNSTQKIQKCLKSNWNCRMWTKKPLSRKRIFVRTPFSHSTLNLKQKSLLQFDFKNHENLWTDLKKRQRPNTIQILWIVKNLEHRKIATLRLEPRSYNNRSARKNKSFLQSNWDHWNAHTTIGKQ